MPGGCGRYPAQVQDRGGKCLVAVRWFSGTRRKRGMLIFWSPSPDLAPGQRDAARLLEHHRAGPSAPLDEAIHFGSTNRYSHIYMRKSTITVFQGETRSGFKSSAESPREKERLLRPPLVSSSAKQRSFSALRTTPTEPPPGTPSRDSDPEEFAERRMPGRRCENIAAKPSCWMEGNISLVRGTHRPVRVPGQITLDAPTSEAPDLSH